MKKNNALALIAILTVTLAVLLLVLAVSIFIVSNLYWAYKKSAKHRKRKNAKFKS